jgi:hypothetical protein
VTDRSPVRGNRLKIGLEALEERKIRDALTLDHLSNCGDLFRRIGIRPTEQPEHTARNRTSCRHIRREVQQGRLAGIAGLYTTDGALVSQAPKVVKTGHQEIEQNYQSAAKSGVVPVSVEFCWAGIAGWAD